MKTALQNAWLRPLPDAPPDRQVLVGDGFDVEDVSGGWAYGRAVKDGYRGWLPESALGPGVAPTHWVAVRTTWGFAAPDIKAQPLVDLHLTSPLAVIGTDGKWIEARLGAGSMFVPSSHCRVQEDHADDPVAVARAFLGTPYVWAGNTGFGIDCSGLVQAALRATGLSCPADSGDQAAMPGAAVRLDEMRAGDLIFWKGHVAMVSGDSAIIHANAHHMAVVEEPMDAAIARIACTDTGDVTSRLRPKRLSSS